MFDIAGHTLLTVGLLVLAGGCVACGSSQGGVMVARDPRGARVVHYPAYLRQLPTSSETWMRLEYQDRDSGSLVRIQFPMACSSIPPEAGPCKSSASCFVVTVDEGEAKTPTGDVALSRSTYWWPTLRVCAQVKSALNPSGPSYPPLWRLVDELPLHVRPAVSAGSHTRAR